MILNRQREVRVERGPLELFLRRVKKELGLAKSDLAVCLVSDAEMARLNQDFRKKKGPTDVLSFPAFAGRRPARLALPKRRRPASEGGRYKSGIEGQYLGDIAISPATARRYAKKYERQLATELRVLILHGILHLLGYDHETDHGEMDKTEQKLRKRLGLT
ncbi:MAG TPA: rRNA maturation RNase YbeY [Candidatus Acidoferrum sp.]|jgi:probable rRNA maturation factor|nr:rRNA maturation RNase YbeY [Candidatus Acidoferrum sp.]